MNARALPMVEIRDLVEPVRTWNPATKPEDTFVYVDLSAISQAEKRILAPTPTRGADAPSRARQLLREGDILVSTVRPNLNGVAPVTVDFDGATASTGFCVLRPRAQKLASDYLMHWVRSRLFVDQMVRQATGASYPAVSDKIIKASAIPLPPLDEQRRIAAILDKADAIRWKHQRALELLDGLTQSIFLQMFGDPSQNPKQLNKVKLGEVIIRASDGPHVSPTYVENGIPFLSTRHIRKSKIFWDDLKYIDQEQADFHWKKCKPEFGDILYTKGGTTGIAATVNTRRPFAVWVHVALLKVDHQIVEPVWLEAMLNSDFCYRQSQIYTHGIANRDLGLKRMVNIDLYLPPLAEQRRFCKSIEKIRVIASKVDRADTESLSLFASLQHRAFSGQL